VGSRRCRRLAVRGGFGFAVCGVIKADDSRYCAVQALNSFICVAMYGKYLLTKVACFDDSRFPV
jgi:hypothetical protein